MLLTVACIDSCAAVASHVAPVNLRPLLVRFWWLTCKHGVDLSAFIEKIIFRKGLFNHSPNMEKEITTSEKISQKTKYKNETFETQLPAIWIVRVFPNYWTRTFAGFEVKIAKIKI